MKYTNHHNLPDEIIRAIENDQYDKGDSVISITGLLQPPRIRLLNKTHEEELVEDYSDQIWKILGQSVHTILERANENYEDTITEERYFAQVMGWKISGQTDSFSMEDRTLKDYKITSVWTIISASKGGKSDWEQQLNSYAYLHYRVHGESIEALQIIAIARDWNKRERQRRGGDYPPSPVSVIDIPLWTFEEQEEFVYTRVKLHQDWEVKYLMDEILPDCSDEDRWKKDDTWRVMKKGRKSALRVLYSNEDAEQYIENSEQKGLTIEHALGEPMRCTGNYCGVAEFCNQFKEEK
jgi:hypothetical protein